MNVPPISTSKPQPTFGILKGYKKTPYGDYTWGIYKNCKVEIFNAYKYDQKLKFVSDKDTLRWVASKFHYLKNGVKKVLKCSARNSAY